MERGGVAATCGGEVHGGGCVWGGGGGRRGPGPTRGRQGGVTAGRGPAGDSGPARRIGTRFRGGQFTIRVEMG